AIAVGLVISVSFAWAAAVPPHDRGPAEAEWRWRGRRGLASGHGRLMRSAILPATLAPISPAAISMAITISTRSEPVLPLHSGFCAPYSAATPSCCAREDNSEPVVIRSVGMVVFPFATTHALK